MPTITRKLMTFTICKQTVVLTIDDFAKPIFLKQLTVYKYTEQKKTERVPWVLKDLRTIENGRIFPFLPKNGGKRFNFLILKKTLQLL